MTNLSEDRLEPLIFNYITNDLSETDAGDLRQWAEEDPVNRQFLEDVGDDDTVLEDLVYYQQIDTDRGYARWRRRQESRRILITGLTTAACLLLAAGLTWIVRVQMGSDAGPRLTKQKDVQPGHYTDSLVLPDGTHVWLNNGSHFHYPPAFTGKKRTVELSGEAYFEIAKNSAQPFIVKADSLSVEAIGTSFNVMAYKEEDSIQTTLITGSVKLQKGNKEVELEPGEQAATGNGSVGFHVKKVDQKAVMAWKDGFFYLPAHSDLRTVVREISRWYNLEVEFKGPVPNRGYGGYIQRNLPLDSLLNILKEKDIHIKRTGKLLLVTP